jgi:hypothetical protein
MGAGFGELDAEEVMTVSLGNEGARRAVCGSALSDVRLRGVVSGFGVAVRPSELPGLPNELVGDGGTALPRAGDDESDPALNGWKETEVRR